MSVEYDLKIAVCDDTSSDLENAVTMIEAILREADLSCSLVQYHCARELYTAIQSGEKFHILLLDVMMGSFGGMELAQMLRQKEDNTMIIFMSHNRELALRGYEVSAVRYLAKPLDATLLKEALLHCHKNLRVKKEILLPTSQGQRRTSFSDIQFVEAYDRGTRFVLNGKTIDTRLKFSEVVALLPKTQFIQCHRAYIVNLADIKRIRSNEFEMRSGLMVPISKYRYSEVSQRFFDYISD